MLTDYLVAGDLEYEYELGAVVRLVVFRLDINGNLNSTAPSTLLLNCLKPDTSNVLSFSLGGGQIKTGSGAQNTTPTPAGSWYFDFDSSISAQSQQGEWVFSWGATGPSMAATTRLVFLPLGYL